ncbi:MAG TPA: DUF1361 domain-containing protein [Chitinophagaceae bacterium]|jgi:uncharacterized membrane protein|nr:DUF1361 domain-containing protein [Chitinophagaceae bacterium]
MKKVLKEIEKRISTRFTLSQWLWIATGFSLSLLAIRIINTGRLSYGFLAWNLFLAYVPYFISEGLGKRPQISASRIKLMLLVFAWILFMPNSFYILTDLFHLNNMSKGDSWYDLTLILSFAWNGVLFGLLSIHKMETLLENIKGKFIAGFIICVVMWLNAFGVYIGRFLRFNSWDILINPFSLVSEIGEIIFNPYDYRYVWAMSFCFAFFMAILYYTTKRLSDVFKNG